MLTAETVTDDQLRELRLSTARLTVGPHVAGIVGLALGDTEEARIVLALKPNQRKVARSRCVQILNASAKEGK